MLSNQQQKKIQKGEIKGMVNAYVCPDLHIIITKCVDNGFIPAQVVCPTCQQPSMSMHFNVNQNLTTLIEWYRPTVNEMKAQLIPMSEQEMIEYKQYLASGGLISRDTTTIIKPFTNEN